MEQRRLTELELRELLAEVTAIREDHIQGRWVAAARGQWRRWEIVLEPDIRRRLLLVITVYASNR